MADIELVVKIDEEEYINIKNAINSLIENGVERASMSKVCLSILDGTPLPKGHGKLVDIDLLRDQVSHDEREAFSKHQVWLLLSAHNKKIPTIIEADREVKNDR